MLKIHSFLQKVKEPIKKLLPNKIGKYKTQMAVISYAMVTVLFILSPDYIYGSDAKNVESYAKAQVIHSVSYEIVEETANEAIVRANETNQDNLFIFCDLTTVNNPDVMKNLKLDEENSSANSMMLGAVAGEKVDSSSTNGKKTNNPDEVVTLTARIAAQETTDTEQETEKTVTNNTEQEEKEAQAEKRAQEKKEAQAEKEAEAEKEAQEKKEAEAEKVAKAEKKKQAEKEKIVVDLSSNEIEILQRIVEAEATGEDIKGKILVANVIMNRVNDDEFPDSVKGVVFQQNGSTYQFSPIKDGRYWSVDVSKDTKTAVKRVMQGEDYSQGALYFSARSKANKSSMSWFDRHLEFLFEYGGHEFFKN